MTDPSPNQSDGPFLTLVIVAAGDAARDLDVLLGSVSPVLDGVAVFIVDNECSDSARDAIEQWATKPGISHLRPGQNLGYGGAANHALGALQVPLPTWVMICNADLVFPPGSLERAIEILKSEAADSRVGCVAPQLHDPKPGSDPIEPGEIQPSVGRFPSLGSLLFGRLRDRRHRKYLRHAPPEPCDVEWATGACLAVRTEAMGDIGGFDEGFFLDYEDTDLCLRLQAHKWRCRIEPSWQVIHVHPNASAPPTPARHAHTRRSLMRYLVQHRPRWEATLMASMYRVALWWFGYSHPFAQGWRAGLDEYSGRSASNS